MNKAGICKLYCDKSRPGIYCYRVCKNGKKIVKTCSFCNKEFAIVLSLKNIRTHCSIACKANSQKLNEEEKTKMMRYYFDKNVVKKDGCWEWKGVKTHGYGSIGLGRKTKLRAHRVSWILHKGHIPKDMFICHKCDNPECTNPAHLFLGTCADNNKDMMQKGRNKGVFKKGRKPNNTLLTENQVKQIKIDLKSKSMTCKQIAEKYNTTLHIIKHISCNKTWRHITID